MKTNFYYFFIAMFYALALSSCSKEDDIIPSPTPTPQPTPTPVVDELKEITFNASLPHFDTRASLSDEGKAIWAAGDAISVFDGSANREFKTAQSGEKVAFTGKVKEAANYYLVYPYQSSLSFENGVIKGFNVLQNQNPVFKDQLPPSSIYVVKAQKSETDVQFIKIGSTVNFMVYGEQATDIRSVTLTSNSDVALSGSIEVDYTGNNPTVKTSPESQYITLETDEGLEPGKEYFVNVLPEILPKGITLTFKNSKGEVWDECIEESIDFSSMLNKSISVNLNLMGDEMLLTDEALIKAAEDECKDYFEKDSNGYVSLKNKKNYDLIKSIKSLTVFNPDYETGDGDLSNEIRYFSSVEELSCLTFRSIALSDLVKLRTLSLNGNLNSTESLIISNCPNLKKLSISYAELTNLDLSNVHSLDTLVLNGNINLKELKIAGNKGISTIISQINPIESLDVSNCSSLKTLSFSGSGTMTYRGVTYYGNYLSNLNLKGCSNLETLSVSENQLTSIDLSDCRKLKYLYLPKNQINRIDLSSIQELEEFDCSYNQISELDLSKCDKLESLYCSDAQLSNLNVSSNKKLHVVHCQNNNIQSLDFSNCKDLMNIECYNNIISSINLTGCSTLNWLWCHQNRLSELDISETSLKNDQVYMSFRYLPQIDPLSFTLYVNENQYPGFNGVYHKVEIKK